MTIFQRLMKTVPKLIGEWWHALEHFMGVALVTREHAKIGHVEYSWDLCDTCGELSGGLAHDLDSGDWYVPGRRELRHNVRLSYEMEDA